jgi:hypothetical protein
MKKILKSKKFLVLIILVALVGLFIVYQEIGKLTPQEKVSYENIEYVKDEFIDASELEMNNEKLVGENAYHQLYFDEETTQFSVKDRKNGVVWYSNPQGSSKIKHQTTLEIDYSVNNGISNSTRNNYEYSINHSNGDKTYKVRYLEDAVQVLYIIEKSGADERYFPQKISVERFETKIVANENLTRMQKKLLEDYYKKETDEKTGETYYIVSVDKWTQTVINNLYEIFYDVCGYTSVDLEADNDEFKVVVSLNEPYFEIAVEYRLTENGLVASVISESIVEKSDFPITTISLLPYFGATSEKEEGYFVFPDGSGVIMRFNNGKNYNSPYSNTFYGVDLGVLPEKKPETKEDLLLPIYGVVNTTNESAMLAIIKKGASATTITADVSGRAKEVYNYVSTTINLRELEGTLFVGRGLTYSVPTWTKTIVPTDIVFEYQFLKGASANYYGLAKQYQEYLIENHGLYKKDNTQKTVLNVNILGMFEKKEFILGVPYYKTDSLTKFDEAITILEELKAKGINNINLMYDGWFNDSIEHSLPTDIDINGVIGGKRDLDDLIQYTEDNNIKFFPTINLMYTNGYEKPFDKIRYTAEHINGKISMLNEYNFATKLRMQEEENLYIISPNLYENLTTKMLREFDNYSFNAIGINDLGGAIAGDYPKNDYTFTNDAEQYQLQALDKITNDYEIMMYSPYGFSATYADNILGVPLTNTKLPILDETIPFYQLVFNGYIDYSGVSINENNELGTNYHKLKAIESGSNVNYVFSYNDSSILLDTDFNNYYSTNYRNWLDSAVQVVKELDDLEIHESSINNHEILAKGVYLISYENGNHFIINYNSLPYTYGNYVVNSQDYLLLGGDQDGNN